MKVTDLKPDAFYWVSSPKHFDVKPTIVQVSTVFGEDPDYWTFSMLGTDQHAMPDESRLSLFSSFPESS